MKPYVEPLPRLQPRWCSGWALLTQRSSPQPVHGSSPLWESCSSTNRFAVHFFVPKMAKFWLLASESDKPCCLYLAFPHAAKCLLWHIKRSLFSPGLLRLQSRPRRMLRGPLQCWTSTWTPVPSWWERESVSLTSLWPARCSGCTNRFDIHTLSTVKQRCTFCLFI